MIKKYGGAIRYSSKKTSEKTEFLCSFLFPYTYNTNKNI